jgi:hypothetical protein
METTQEQALAVVEADFKMLATPDQALDELRRVQEFIKKVMEPGVDYGNIPGTGDKPTLLQPGAQKLAEVYGLAPTIPDILTSLERWDADPPFFNYVVRVRLIHKRSGTVAAEGIGSCNSMEVRYRYRWTGKGVEKERVINHETADMANTYLKMAVKRATVAAVLAATRMSGMFTQDVEDIESLREEGAAAGRQIVEADSYPCEWAGCKSAIKTSEKYKAVQLARWSVKDCNGAIFCYHHKEEYKKGVRPKAAEPEPELAPEPAEEDDGGLIANVEAIARGQGKARFAALCGQIREGAKTAAGFTQDELERLVDLAETSA